MDGCGAGPGRGLGGQHLTGQPRHMRRVVDRTTCSDYNGHEVGS